MRSSSPPIVRLHIFNDALYVSQDLPIEVTTFTGYRPFSINDQWPLCAYLIRQVRAKNALVPPKRYALRK